MSRSAVFLSQSSRILSFGVILLGLLAWLAPSARGQGSFQARLFDQEDGLQSPSVTDLAQDGKGYLWVATENGLFQYSGSHFEEFGRKEGFNEPAVYSLLIDRLGTVWAGTHTGLYWFGLGRFHELLYRGKTLRIGMNSMLAATAAGELIVQARGEIVSVMRDRSGHGWEAVPYRQRHPSFPIYSDTNGIGVDAEDHLLIGCDEAICQSGSPPRTLGPLQGVPPDYYMSFFRARTGQLWARGRKHIVTWRSGDAQVRDLSALFPAGAMSTVSRRFTEDSLGQILTPTAEGFASWDGLQWAETRSTSKGPLHGVTAVFADREGAVWLGTTGSGLLQSLGYRQWAIYGSTEGLSNPTVYALAEDRGGRIWIGTGLTANVLGSRSGEPALSPLGGTDAATMVQAFAPTPDGGMWAATLTGGLSHTDDSGRIDIRTSVDAYVAALRLDSKGTLWMATSAGLFTVQCTRVKPCAAQSVTGLAGRRVNSLVFDYAGGLWVASDQGLDHLENGRLSHVAVAGVSQNFSHVALADDDQLWLSGQAPGVYRVRVRSGAATVIEAHTRPELLSDRIQFLEPGLHGELWVGTDRGVNVLDQGRISGITTEDGLLSNDVSSFLAVPGGTVWIGSVQGVSHLLQPEAALKRAPFAAKIDQFYYGDTSPAAGDKLPWKASYTLVRSTAFTFRGNSSLLYHYQLQGFDATPITTPSSLARFPKLPPGRYTFRVVAEDPVHHVFSAPAVLTFELVPPWWRSTLMHVAMVLAALGLLGCLWRWSQMALLAQRTKLQRMVMERTRELEEMAIRDSLTGLLNRKALMARLQEEVEYARRHKTALCIALLDLDHFKQINDTLGHLAGDEVLRESARRLAAAVRSTDTVGRYGGEEFLVIFRNVEQQFGLEHCERIRQQICGEPITFEDKSLTVTTSIGLAWSRQECDFNGGMVASADRAMYDAKSTGRNRVVCAFPTTVIAEGPAMAQA